MNSWKYIQIWFFSLRLAHISTHLRKRSFRRWNCMASDDWLIFIRLGFVWDIEKKNSMLENKILHPSVIQIWTQNSNWFQPMLSSFCPMALVPMCVQSSVLDLRFRFPKNSQMESDKGFFREEKISNLTTV